MALDKSDVIGSIFSGWWEADKADSAQRLKIRNEELANKIKSEIPEAIIPEHKSNLSSPALVTALSSRLESAISIDNGVMHMIALSNVPIVVLFGPTNSEKFAPSCKDSIILDSKRMYKTENISAITVEDVQLAAKQFLNF